MIRCIEEAIKSGAITREEGRRLQERVDNLLDEGLGGADVRDHLSKTLAAEAKEAKRRALLQEARRKVLTDIVLSYRNARGENDPAQALWLLLDDTSQRGVKGIETTRLVIIGRAHEELSGLLDEFRKGALLGDKRRQTEAVQASMRNFLKELHGEGSGDVRAKELADAWLKVAERLRQRANKAGMAIGKLENWGMPQTWNREALLRAGRERFVDFMMNDVQLDRARMTEWMQRPAYTDEELRDGLSMAWRTITSDGAFSREPSYGGPGKGALARRFDGRHRWMHFASADDWWKAQQMFGEGDPFRTMMQHINLMARDIATLEVLGPNPEAMRNYLKSLVSNTAAVVEPADAVLKNNMLRLRQALDQAGVGSAGRDVLDNIEQGISALGYLKRKARASGNEPAELKTVEANLETAVRELGALESRATSERRAVLAKELERLDGLRADIERKAGARYVANVPKEARRRHEALRVAEQDLTDRIEKARAIEAADISVLDRAIDLLKHPSRSVEPSDVYGLFGAGSSSARLYMQAQARNWPRSRLLLERLNDDFNARSIWLPGDVRQRLLDPRMTRDEMLALLEGLRWGGLAEARVRQLEELKASLRVDREALQRAPTEAMIALSRRNRKRVAQINAERSSVQRQLARLDEEATTLATHDPRQYRQILSLIRSAQQAADEVGIVGSESGFLSVTKPQDAARVAIDKFDRLWDLSRGTYFVPVNATWANALQGFRNLLTAKMLGSAAITAIGDIGTQAVARKMAGMSGNLGTVVKGMLGQWSHASRTEAVRSGLILDEALHVASQEARFMEQINTVHLSGYIADRVLSLSGLSWMTQSAKHAFGMSFQAHVADSLHMRLDDLAKSDPNLERALRRNGITDLEWEMLRQSQVHQPEPGVRWLRPSEVANGPGGEALSEKYLAMILRMTRQAVVEGTPEARVMWGGGRPGTFIGELSRNAAQFRSYSVSFMLLHMRDILWTAQEGRAMNAVSHAAYLAIAGTVLGALAIDLNELAGGKDPLFGGKFGRGEMPSWQDWGRAYLKAGGLGIYGDFAFASTHFLSKGAVEVLAGPLPGFFESTRRQAAVEIENSFDGKMNPEAAARSAFKTARALTPGTTIWWLKGPLNNAVLDRIDHTLFPERAEKSWAMTERMRKKGGMDNKSWWRRGELLPERAPALVAP